MNARPHSGQPICHEVIRSIWPISEELSRSRRQGVGIIPRGIEGFRGGPRAETQSSSEEFRAARDGPSLEVNLSRQHDMEPSL